MTDLRLRFDEDPLVYDRVRPTYPDQLFDDLAAFAGNGRPLRVCEIGAGTGKATGSLLARGWHVTAVEIGPALAAFLRERFAERPNLRVVEAPFEEAATGPGPFDVVLSATAWHWIDPIVRLQRSAATLDSGGVLAIVDTNQVASPADSGYFAESQRIYARYFDGEPPPLPGPDVVPPAFAELSDSDLFEQPRLFHYPWDRTYNRADYQDLMRSYSNMRAMKPAEREQLISELGALIDAEYGGFVTRPLVVTLTVARVAASGGS